MKSQISVLCWVLVVFASSGITLAANEPALHTGPKVTEAILYRFRGGADGAHPNRGVILGSAGNLYGITPGTPFGQSNGCKDCGTAFEISGKTHAEKTLHRFTGGEDGANPGAGLIFDSEGNLYGTTEFGGPNCTRWVASGCGTVFEIAAQAVTRCETLCGTRFQISDRVHAETILWSFPPNGGSWPTGGVIMDAAGNLYGTTSTGRCPNGHYGCGTVFEIPGGSRGAIVLHTFAGGGDADGFPKRRLVMDQHGNLYGMTWSSNLQNPFSGIVFEIFAGTHKEKTLHRFAGGPPDGNLIIDRKGDLFGTTQWGGGFCNAGGSPGTDAMGCGVVFEIAAGTSKETIVYRFKGGRDGMEPDGLVMDSAGNLYGTTSSGGSGCGRYGCGTVFEIPSGTRKKRTLYRFKGGRDGATPEGPLVMDRADNLYGTTFKGGENCATEADLGPGCGTVYEIIRQ
ncbi:MAG: hypothetical protein M0038_09965 [Pseudomonadota bacterium]|nr:hypothetical protein [Pseudomonadota bacterium]